MNDPRRIALVSSSLSCGGAERVLSLMANHWAERGRDVSILTLNDAAAFFALDRRVSHVRLGVERPTSSLPAAVAANLGKIRALRSALRAAAPEVVVGFLSGVSVLTREAAASLGLPVVLSERNHPELAGLSPLWKTLRDRAYRRAELLVVQTERAADYYRARGVRRVRVVPNPIEAPPPCPWPAAAPSSPADALCAAATAGAPPGARERLILNVGRLVPQKGHDLLLRAFAASGLTDWRLAVLGEGGERAALEALAQELGLADRVRFEGQVVDKTAWFSRAAIFAFSSRWEGFPNALCEAMAAGLACVSFDCPYGPREIIRPGVDGLLAPEGDVEAFAAALRRLAAAPEERLALGSRARELAERLSIERVMEAWDEALREVVS